MTDTDTVAPPRFGKKYAGRAAWSLLNAYANMQKDDRVRHNIYDLANEVLAICEAAE